MSYRLAALVLIVAVQTPHAVGGVAQAQTTTLTSRPGALPGEPVYQDPSGKIVGASKPGAFTGETFSAWKNPDGSVTKCTTRPGALQGETVTRCQ